MYRLLALVLLFPAAAAAQTCGNAATQAEMNQCASDELEAADRALNDAFRDAMASQKAIDAGLPVERQGAETALRKAQRAWITYRDEGCAAEGFVYEGGSIRPMVVLSCKTRVTQERVGALKSLAAGAEGL